MTYKCVIHKLSGGLWCACKVYEDATIGSDYAFALKPSIVQYKLVEDGEDEENIVVEN